MTQHLAGAALLVLLAWTPVAAQAPICVLPEEPWVPGNEADFRGYVDLIAAEFERYFSELTRYFQCLERTWHEGIEQGRRVSAARETFVARATALGLGPRLGVDPPHPSGRRPE